MAGALAFEFVTPPDPGWRSLRFDFDRDPARMAAFSAVCDTYRDATLSAPQARRQAADLPRRDPIFSALESVDYWRLARSRQGRRYGPWARLFLVPGMNHCAGGPATDSFDGLARCRLGRRARPSSRRRRGGARISGRTRPSARIRPPAIPATAWRMRELGLTPRRAPTGEATARCAAATLDSRPGDAGARFITTFRDHARALTLRRGPPQRAGDDPAGRLRSAVWDLTNTHGSLRTVFMRAPTHAVRAGVVGFFDIPRGERPANPWDRARRD